ncbi:hypothetical protein CBF34_03000 [Vagococcus penaei]|uniref:Uncharacterized protein n=1 Tax=Vagococcus penaei TaxID=633807 RepID=A0A1Q2D3Y8_9ENTE|nr:hypothetical protein [Vagococcus penaei]AQP53043.1 hypothetical protein BW732_01585 [Vagococcus penaei]RSU06094.1 hypothetical protein CBF34_03000 [Vagococcus penaei]
MKNLRLTALIVTVLWVIALWFSYNPSLFWYAYLFLSGITLTFAFFLLYQIKLKQTYQQSNEQKRRKATRKRLKLLTYFSKQQRLTGDNSTSQPDPNVKSRRYIETTNRPRKNAQNNLSFFTTKDKMSSIKNKEYLHSKIPLLYQGSMQETLSQAIQQLKEQHYFTSFYGNVTNNDLILHFEEYEGRNIFELYDNIIPNTFAKVLYDPNTDTNRIGIFLHIVPKNCLSEPIMDEDSQEESTDIMLGFIAMEDTHRANLLLKKYDNIQVFATIVGGTYKRVYQNELGEIRIIKDFINYDLTISLAFYNS